MESIEIPTIQNYIMKRFCQELISKLESYVIEGLKRKGFEFDDKIEFEKFIKTRVKRTDNIEFKEHVYYVDDIPFFLHKYEIIYNPIEADNNGIRISANYGSFAYL